MPLGLYTGEDQWNELVGVAPQPEPQAPVAAQTTQPAAPAGGMGAVASPPPPAPEEQYVPPSYTDPVATAYYEDPAASAPAPSQGAIGGVQTNQTAPEQTYYDQGVDQGNPNTSSGSAYYGAGGGDAYQGQYGGYVEPGAMLFNPAPPPSIITPKSLPPVTEAALPGSASMYYGGINSGNNDYGTSHEPGYIRKDVLHPNEAYQLKQQTQGDVAGTQPGEQPSPYTLGPADTSGAARYYQSFDQTDPFYSKTDALGRLLGLDPTNRSLDMANQIARNVSDWGGDQLGMSAEEITHPAELGNFLTTEARGAGNILGDIPGRVADFAGAEGLDPFNYGGLEDLVGPLGNTLRQAQSSFNPVGDAAGYLRDAAGAAKDEVFNPSVEAWQSGAGAYFDKSYQGQRAAIDAGLVPPGETSKTQVIEDSATAAIDDLNEVAFNIPSEEELNAMPMDALRVVMSDPRTPDMVKQKAAVIVGRRAAQEAGLINEPLIQPPDLGQMAGNALQSVRTAGEAALGPPPQSAYDPLSSATLTPAPSSRPIPAPPPLNPAHRFQQGVTQQIANAPSYYQSGPPRSQEMPASLPVNPAHRVQSGVEQQVSNAPSYYDQRPSTQNVSWTDRLRQTADRIGQNSQDTSVFGQDTQPVIDAVNAVRGGDIPDVSLPNVSLPGVSLPSVENPPRLGEWNFDPSSLTTRWGGGGQQEVTQKQVNEREKAAASGGRSPVYVMTPDGTIAGVNQLSPSMGDGKPFRVFEVDDAGVKTADVRVSPESASAAEARGKTIWNFDDTTPEGKNEIETLLDSGVMGDLTDEEKTNLRTSLVGKGRLIPDEWAEAMGADTSTKGGAAKTAKDTGVDTNVGANKTSDATAGAGSGGSGGGGSRTSGSASPGGYTPRYSSGGGSGGGRGYSYGSSGGGGNYYGGDAGGSGRSPFDNPIFARFFDTLSRSNPEWLATIQDLTNNSVGFSGGQNSFTSRRGKSRRSRSRSRTSKGSSNRNGDSMDIGSKFPSRKKNS
jgi:hypothetical protein